MIKHLSKILFTSYALLSIGNSQLTIKSYNHSVVMPVPDLSFHTSIFYGLDVLEQMDFKPIYDKNIGVFTNQSAINRKGIHILDSVSYTHLRLPTTTIV